MGRYAFQKLKKSQNKTNNQVLKVDKDWFSISKLFSNSLISG